MTRFLTVLALVAALLDSAHAGIFQGSTCCLCECPGVAAQCRDVNSPTACGPILGGCTTLNCDGAIIYTPCAEVAQCAAAAGPAPAPTLDASGLAIVVVVLGGLAALRLRRPARQRQRQRPRQR